MIIFFPLHQKNIKKYKKKITNINFIVGDFAEKIGKIISKNV